MIRRRAVLLPRTCAGYATMLAAVSLLPAGEARVFAQLPLEYAPYRIEVLYAVEDPADLAVAGRLEPKLAELADAYIGPAWQLQATQANAELRNAMLTHFDELTAERVMELLAEQQETDKCMLMLLGKRQGRWSLEVRELDMRTFHLSPSVQRTSVSTERLTDEAFNLIVAAFSPVAELRAAQRGEVQGTLQAAGLVTDSDSPVLVRAGDPLIPMMRYNDRLGRAGPEDVVVIPWTVLETRACDGAKLTCQIHTAHRSPLGGKSRLRLKRYALATRYPGRPTRLQLQTPDEQAKPLVGYELVARDDESGDFTLVGRTDHAGAAYLPAGDERWRLLYVRHGDRLLARLPLATGWSERYTVELPSDDIRLAAAGFIAALRQELIDTVARRQIMATRIRRRIAAGRFGEAEQLLQQLRRLDDARPFRRRLEEARGRLIADNARSQQLIDQMFNETQQVLQRYLDPREADALASQLAGAREEG